MATTVETLKDLLSLTAAARIAGVSRSTLDVAEVNGEIQAALWTSLGRLFRRDDVEKWAAAREAR